ncbi:hypothetical protein [Deinococcus marmoris]|uniref:Hydrolases of HD superfamily n=1 Tax=Deinococcus marmoris TaxID=249408 RepID=A0A1U7P4R5_9DEIO|nr:hypothetical protein [Deinococcus marmoris]OLV20163.1 hydrolases of HD superfamily [Deinococcus marmoris]
MTAPTHPAWNQTHGHVAFDFLSPTPAHIKDADVAHALAHINRFTGHLNRAFSVAQHSLLVVELLAERGHRDAGLLLQGLVHDAAECYVGDVSAPLKRLLPDYQKVEARVWAACAAHYGVPVELDPAVKAMDWHACRLEAHAHLLGGPIYGWAGEDETEALSQRARNILYGYHATFTIERRFLVTLDFLRDAAAMQQTVLMERLGARGWL